MTMVAKIQPFGCVLDMLSLMWMETSMFGLALLVYALVSGQLYSMMSIQRKWRSAFGNPKQHKVGDAYQHMQGMATSWQAVSKALRQGKLGDALNLATAAAEKQTVPVSVATLILVALASSLPDSEVEGKMRDLEGTIPTRALEAAASQLQQRADTSACRRLIEVSQILRVPERARVLASFPEPQNVTFGKEARELGKDAVGQAEETRVIFTCGKRGDLRGAVEAFDRLKGKAPTLTCAIYNHMVGSCVTCGDLQLASKYLREAAAQGLADAAAYSNVISGYLAAGATGAAHVQELLAEMSESGASASYVTCHGLLNKCVKAGDRVGAWSLVDQMQAVGLKANLVTCSILLKLVEAGSRTADISKVMFLINEIDEPMDDVLSSSLVEACMRARQLDFLMATMRQRAKQGYPLNLTSPAYGSLMKACGQAHHVDRVLELWREMVSRHIHPTPVTVGVMVEALVSNRHVDDAFKLVRELLDSESTRPLVNTVTYSTLLKGFAMAGQDAQLMRIYEEMQSQGVPCNTITYNTMLNAFARSSEMHRVPKLLEDMRMAEPKVEPDIVTYSTIVKGYCKSGDLDKGIELLQQMKHEGKFAPDEVLYNSLLDGCAKQRRLDDALMLLDDMSESNVAPSNYTLSILVKLLGRSRRLNQAFNMVDMFCSKHGLSANVHVYTCLMQACINNRQVGRALELHDRIAREGCALDEKAYTVLARGCLQAGLVDKAAEVTRCAFHLPGHQLVATEGQAPGVDSAFLQDVVAALVPGSARKLVADIESARNRGGSGIAVAAKGRIPPWRRSSSSRENGSSSDRSPCSGSSEDQ